MPVTLAHPKSHPRYALRRCRLRLLRFGLSAAGGLLAASVVTACGTSGHAPAASPQSDAGVSMSSMPMSAAGPASSSSTSTMTQSASMIHISGFKYTVPASVAPGATVSVMNMDGENHTVTADAGNAFDVKANAGSTVTFAAPKTPGSYSFHCTYHSNMRGVLVVK